MQGPNKFPLAELVVAGDESSRRDDFVAHLLEGIEDVEGWRGKFHPPILFILVLRQCRGLLRQHPELVEGQSVHCAAGTTNGEKTC